MEYKELGKFEFSFVKGLNPIKSVEGNSYLIPSGAIFPSGINISKTHKIITSPRDKDKILIENDILFNTGGEGTIGRSCLFNIVSDLYFVDGFVVVLRQHSEYVNPKFIFYCLSTSKTLNQIANLKDGTTGITSIKVSNIKKLLIPVIELPEQNKITEILSKIDKAISETEVIIAKYNRIKTGLMQDLLTKGIDEKGNIRREETHEFKDSPLGRIPKEWSPKKLNDCINKSTTITYGIVQTYEHIEDGIPVLRTIDLKENGLNSIDNLLRTKKSISDMYKRTLLSENDIVCNVRASVGDFNIVTIDYVGCNTTRGVARICPSDGINNNYLLWFLKSYRNEKQMELLIKGTTFIDINIADLRKIIVLLPSKTEQDLIADKLDKIQTTFHKYNIELSKLKSIKTGLMQDLLSGKKRVTHLIN